jgi:AcrR family transcriptional regulator
MARKHGLYDMTRKQVAADAGVGNGTVTLHFGDMVGLRRAVVQQCIERLQFLDVLAQALSRRDFHASRAPADVKRAALDTIA